MRFARRWTTPLAITTTMTIEAITQIKTHPPQAAEGACVSLFQQDLRDQNRRDWATIAPAITLDPSPGSVAVAIAASMNRSDSNALVFS